MDLAPPFDTAWLTTVLLLSLRLASVFLMTPLLAVASVPPMVRILLVLGLAGVLSLGLPQAARSAELPAGAGALAQAALGELALGATLSLGILLAFAASSMAGQLLGIQMGFGLGQVIDPISNSSVPVLSSAFDQLAVVVFFLGNGHHALLRGLAYSLERFPLGRPWPIEAGLGPIALQVTGFFSLGFVLAAPVVFSLFMLELALGAVSRSMPQINMLALGIPAKVIVGLAALSLWFGGMGDGMNRIYGSIYRCWDAIFAVASAESLRLESLHASLPPSSCTEGVL
jgi:flagellar biosynthetic protein FliR